MATPSAPISIGSTVSIGGGRGRLAPNPAASIARIDAQLGRPADINDAWRSPEQADKNRDAWLAFLNGTGPWAPFALDRWGSIHCRGYATDSDDWYSAPAATIWRRNGWRQTALYKPGDPRREEWHGEYDEALDEYLGQPAGESSSPFDPVPHDPRLDQIMSSLPLVLKIVNTDAAGVPTNAGLAGVQLLLDHDHGYVYPADQAGAVANVSAPYFNNGVATVGSKIASTNGAVVTISQENLHILLRDLGFPEPGSIVESVAVTGGGHFYR